MTWGLEDMVLLSGVCSWLWQHLHMAERFLPPKHVLIPTEAKDFFLSRISSHQIVEVVEEVIRRKRGFLITTLTNGVNLRLYLITAIIGDFFLVYFFTFFSFVLYHLLFKF